MAAGGAGGEPVTSGRPLLWVNVSLYVVALLLGCFCIFFGVKSWDAYQDRQTERVDQERYGDVVAAARATTEAFLNIDYRHPEETQEAVEATATGKFLKEFRETFPDRTRLLRQSKSVTEGHVKAAAVDTIDSDSASVLVATSGTARNVATRGQESARNFRLRLDLVREDGRWLTTNLEIVG